MNMLSKIARAVEVIMPWPGKHERAEAIREARRERKHAQEDAAHAKVIERQINRMLEENHFAETIARQILQGQGHRHA
jgi:hypothetical protein